MIINVIISTLGGWALLLAVISLLIKHDMRELGVKVKSKFSPMTYFVTFIVCELIVTLRIFI